MIHWKTEQEIALLKRCGLFLSHLFEQIESLIEPKKTLHHLRCEILSLFEQEAANVASRRNLSNIPRLLFCELSLFEQAKDHSCRQESLQQGDLLTIDLSCQWEGWNLDQAVTYPVGVLNSERQFLLSSSHELLNQIETELHTSETWSAVASSLQRWICEQHLDLLGCCSGHGIGRELHEDPQIWFSTPSFLPAWEAKALPEAFDFPIRSGLVIAVEPRLSLGFDVAERNAVRTITPRALCSSVYNEAVFAVTQNRVERITKTPRCT